MGKLLAIMCGVGILSAFYLYVPVPDDLEDRGVFRVGHCLVRLLHCIMYLDVKYYNGMMAYHISRQPPIDSDPGSLLVTDTDFDGVPVKLFQPQLKLKKDKLLPAIVYFHGGGFVLGNPDLFFDINRNMSEELHAVVASVDYRLAPKHKFPAAFEDALKATKWFLVNAKQYNVDHNKVAVSGDSAGGLLTAAVTQFIKDDPSVPDIYFQALIYPSTQQIEVNLPSAQQYHAIFGNKGVLCRQDVAMFIGIYAFGEFRQDYYDAYVNDNTIMSSDFRKTSHLMKYVDHDVILQSNFRKRYYIKPDKVPDKSELWDDIKNILLDVRISPLLRDDMSGLPPAWIATCEYDPLRDDGILYAHRLLKAGVHVQHNHYKGGYHGVWMYSGIHLETFDKMWADFLVFAKQYMKSN